jgi:hypothetical protein
MRPVRHKHLLQGTEPDKGNIDALLEPQSALGEKVEVADLFTSENVKTFEREYTKLYIHISPLHFYYYFMYAHAFNHNF